MTRQEIAAALSECRAYAFVEVGSRVWLAIAGEAQRGENSTEIEGSTGTASTRAEGIAQPRAA